MRKTIAIGVLLLCTLTMNAQSHSDHIGLGTGVFYEPAAEASIFWEHETRYHNAWEVFAQGYLKYDSNRERLIDGYKTWGVGMAVKPCVYRARNRYGSLRLGASVGSNTHNVLAGIHAGYEHNYALKHGWKIYWQAKVDVMLPKRDDLFRTSLCIGVKLPSRDHLKH